MDKVHGWVTRKDGDTIIVPLGEFFSGQTRSVLWKFTLPKDAKAGDTIAFGPLELTFNRLDDAVKLQRIQTEPLRITLTDDKDQVAQARDMEVAARIAEIELATSMENAADLVAAGKYEEAKQVLGLAVTTAQQRGQVLTGTLKDDLMAAATEAENLQKQVDSAQESAEEAKILTKQQKASSYNLKKK